MRQTSEKGKSKRYLTDNIKSFEVLQETTLLPFLFETLVTKSKTKIKSLLRYKHIALKGKVVTQFNTPLLPGDLIEVNFGRSFYEFKHPLVRILYEDEWIVVIEKASGLLSVANEFDKKKNARHIITEYVRQEDPDANVYVCHRLDQYTSGILLLSKNREVMMEMRKNWDFYVKERKYMCVTENIPSREEDEIRSYLRENDFYQMQPTSNQEEGQLAITRYKVLQTKGRFALVDVEIFTGKKNQIRVHMAQIGCPIAGDSKYGAETNPIRRLMLHNYRLSFIHPISGELIRLSLTVPRNFLVITNSKGLKML
ncbi:MAG TPA: RluA family pseudouridine synthase [Bacteroidaceae bacterium]|nr:RluA family pseudouridine synthase [Bacteroidaceae bacterium]